jgi:guanylate cyclase
VGDDIGVSDHGHGAPPPDTPETRLRTRSLRSASVDPNEKPNKVRLAVATVAGGGHVIQTGVFFAFGHPRLAIASFAAVLVFVVVVLLVRRGHGRLGGWIAYLEILLHLSFMIWVWGPAAGYWTYYVPLAGGAFIAFAPHERWDRRIGVIAPFIVAPLAYVYSRGRGPAIDVSESTLSTLAMMNVFGALLGTASIVGWFATVADRAEQAAAHERDRSEALLLNILPSPIAARLKDGPTTIADSFDAVTVLFADIVGFTTLSSRITTDELILVLNEIFSAFDALAAKHGLEKIKTIGDAYMVVGGVPTTRADHAEAIARMALDMRDTIAKRDNLDIRIGIHSGPVVAGVIGTRKFSYDLWGDTVNTASRMESHGEPGRIQVSDVTRDLLAKHFDLTERGTIVVKGKGEMHTWFLDREL